jgi:hypothetical protein
MPIELVIHYSIKVEMMISLLKTIRVLHLAVGLNSIGCLYFPLMNIKVDYSVSRLCRRLVH